MRAEALKFIVHFVGDIHQPMHAALEARGGNEVHIQFFGSDRCGSHYACNLHALWDSGMIQHAGIAHDKYAMRFEATFTNLPNHPNFAAPATNVSAPASFGQITTVQTADNAGNRTGQLALRLDF